MSTVDVIPDLTNPGRYSQAHRLSHGSPVMYFRRKPHWEECEIGQLLIGFLGVVMDTVFIIAFLVIIGLTFHLENFGNHGRHFERDVSGAAAAATVG